MTKSRPRDPGTKFGYCRRTQSPLQGCGAGSQRKLTLVTVGRVVRLWLCQACLKKHGLGG